MPKITKRFIDRLGSLRGDRDKIYWDNDLRGFGVRLKGHPSRAAAYLVQYRNAARESKRLTFSAVGTLTPEEARVQARKHLGVVDKGGDPAAERKALATDPTVAELCDHYIKEGPAWRPNKKTSTWATEKSNIERHIKPLIGSRKQRTINSTDVERFQRDVKRGDTKATIKTKKRGKAIIEGGASAAGRAVAVLSTVFAFAAARGMRPDNPVLGVKREAIRRRERFLATAELGKIGEAMAALETEGTNKSALNALRLLLLSGCRRSEVTGLRWRDVDFDHGVLRLADSKTGPREVPLGAAALLLLATVPREKGAMWVFPASRGKGSTQGLPKIWKSVLKRAGVDSARIHDLRHTFASVSVASGEAIYLTGKVLGHREGRTTERYAHLARSPIQDVADRTSNRIAAAMKGGGTENVVAIAKAKA